MSITCPPTEIVPDPGSMNLYSSLMIVDLPEPDPDTNNFSYLKLKYFCDTSDNSICLSSRNSETKITEDVLSG